jgi:hypothetical protein
MSQRDEEASDSYRGVVFHIDDDEVAEQLHQRESDKHAAGASPPLSTPGGPVASPSLGNGMLLQQLASPSIVQPHRQFPSSEVASAAGSSVRFGVQPSSAALETPPQYQRTIQAKPGSVALESIALLHDDDTPPPRGSIPPAHQPETPKKDQVAIDVANPAHQHGHAATGWSETGALIVPLSEKRRQQQGSPVQAEISKASNHHSSTNSRQRSSPPSPAGLMPKISKYVNASAIFTVVCLILIGLAVCLFLYYYLHGKELDAVGSPVSCVAVSD